MFDSICIRNQSLNDVSIDMGFLAEAMLFYSDVLILAREQMIEQLVMTFKPEVLLEFLEAGYLKIIYEHELTGIQTRNSGSSQERYSGIKFHSPSHSLQHVAPIVFQKVSGKSGRGRRFANRFTQKVEAITRDNDVLLDFRSDLSDSVFINSVVRKLIQFYAPEYELPNPLVFEVYEDGKEYSIETNIDFIEINKIYHLHIPPSHSSIDRAFFLSHVLTTIDNLYFASTLNSDIALNSIESEILVTKVNGILNQYNTHISQLRTFQDFIFDDGRAISEAINTGQRSFKDLLKILEHADKFKTWVKSKSPDVNLVKEYFREATKSSWIDILPGKSLRWVFFTGSGLAIDAIGAGGIGTAIGLGLNAADSFILDRILKGWKPNNFIDGPIKRFLNNK